MSLKGKPLTEEEFIKLHRADFKQRGFDEQMYCMAWYVLQIDTYDFITWEKQDDLVISYQNGSKLLIQVKSSVGENAKITDSSIAFWKTIDNWLDFNDTQTIKFSSSVKYCLHTDMQIANDCALAIKNLQDGDCYIQDVITKLISLKNDNTCGDTVKRLLALPEKELNKFFMKIDILSDFDALRMLYRKFLQQFNAPVKADKIVEELLGRMFIHKGEAAKNHVNWYYQKQDFLARFRDILCKVGDDELTPVDYDDELIVMPNGYKDMVFAKQLDSIGVADINENQNPTMLEYYGYLLQCENSISYFYQVQLMNSDFESMINKNAVEVWRTPFERRSMQATRKGNTEDAIKESGAECFYDVMEKDIPYGNKRKMIAPLSKGWFIRLSNKRPPSVKWRKDWK